MFIFFLWLGCNLLKSAKCIQRVVEFCFYNCLYIVIEDCFKWIGAETCNCLYRVCGFRTFITGSNRADIFSVDWMVISIEDKCSMIRSLELQYIWNYFKWNYRQKHWSPSSLHAFYFISATSTTKNTVAVSLTIFNTIDLLNSM